MAALSRGLLVTVILISLVAFISLSNSQTYAIDRTKDLSDFKFLEISKGKFLLSIDFDQLSFGEPSNVIYFKGCNTYYYSQGLILPSRVLKVVLGAGVEKVDISIIDIKVKTVRLTTPIRHSVTLTIFSERGMIRLPSEKRAVVEKAQPIIIRGVYILPIRFNPVLRVNQEHITYVSSITLRLNVVKKTMCKAHITKTFYKVISSIADNPLPEDEFVIGPPSIDYLIITREAFTTELQPLIEEKESHGLKVKVLTLEYILENYNGSDIPEKIRNAIIDYYKRFNIEWVLIVGDDDVIPARRVLCNDIYPGVKNEPSIFPTDYYYAGLNGTWNADGDEYYGEAEDNVDYGADVFVGRLPVKNVHELRAVIRKIVRYSRNPISPDKAHKMLLCGAILSFKGEAFGGGDLTDDAILKTRMIEDFIPDYVNCTRVFQREYTPCECDYPLLLNIVESLFSDGYPLVNFAGHGNSKAIYRKLWFDLDDDGVPDMDEIEPDPYFKPYDYNNTDCPSLVYASACRTASMEEDSLGKDMIRYENGGAIAYIGCVHDTWYASGWRFPGTGYDQELDYLFWKTFFSLEYSLRKPGLVFYKAKLLYASLFVRFPTGLGYECNRKIILAYTLYGDPEIQIWCDDDVTPPNILSYQCSGNMYDNNHSPYMIEIVLNDSSGIFSAWFRYSFDNVTWSSWIPYSQRIGENRFRFYIPYSEWSAHVGSVIYWQIKAEDNDSEEEFDRAVLISRVFEGGLILDDDPSPPTIIAEAPEVVYDNWTKPIILKAIVSDESGVLNVSIRYRFEGMCWSEWMEASYDESGYYYIEVPRSIWINFVGSKLYWQVAATDRDDDRPGDASTAIVNGTTIAIMDDDVSPPEIIDAFIEDANYERDVDAYDSFRFVVVVYDQSPPIRVSITYIIDGRHYNIECTQVNDTVFVSDWMDPLPQFTKIVWNVIVADGDRDRIDDVLSTSLDNLTYVIRARVYIECLAMDSEHAGGVSLKLLYNGQLIGESISNSSGWATLSTPFPGNFTLEASYKGLPVGSEIIEVNGNMKTRIVCKLYDWILEFKSMSGSRLSNLMIIIESVEYNCSLLETYLNGTSKLSIKNLPGNVYRLKVYYLGKIVFNDTLNLEKDDQVNVVKCSVYRVKIYVEAVYGGPVKDCDVIVLDDKNCVVFREKTDEAGQLMEVLLPAGSYRVKIIKNGVTSSEYTITVDGDSTIRIQLQDVIRIPLLNVEMNILHFMLFIFLPAIALSMVPLLRVSLRALPRKKEEAEEIVVIEKPIIRRDEYLEQIEIPVTRERIKPVEVKAPTERKVERREPTVKTEVKAPKPKISYVYCPICDSKVSLTMKKCPHCGMILSIDED